MLISKLAGLVGLLVLAATDAASQGAEMSDRRIVTFGSGPIDGAYYAVVSAICARFNERHTPALQCSPDPTPGSLYNLSGLERGDLDFALVQSDWQRAAVEGRVATSGDGKMEGLRSVLSLYPEPFTILARRESGIRSLADLRGRRIDQGARNSGRRATVNRVFDALGLASEDFAELTEHVTTVALNELCADNLDAVLLVIGHPNRAVARTLRACDVMLVDATDPGLRSFISENPDYAQGDIPAHSYPEMVEDVATFSVMATVVAMSDLPKDLVQILVTTVLEEMGTLAERAPVIGNPDVSQLASRGLTAPLHPGAAAALALE